MNASDAQAFSAAWQAGVERWTEEFTRLNQAADPFGVGASFFKVAEGWRAHPAELATALARLARDVQSMQLNAWQAATILSLVAGFIVSWLRFRRRRWFAEDSIKRSPDVPDMDSDQSGMAEEVVEIKEERTDEA